ncbi:MAG: alanine--tRNA ligase [Bacteroidota bacterium]
MLTSAAIRQKFLAFFQSREHSIVPSAPIVIKNDPSLLFTNAGMNQFKDYFLGNKKPEHIRVADTQKCLRVSGKHNDLEEVGVDTYHHTMFEMLGNWSFGDYFKKEAIAWAWELLTEVLQLNKDRLYVTIFEGDDREGLLKDEEAFAEWEKWIATDRILPGNKKDNFWEMGDTGPCGPCSEIHVDCRGEAERKQVDGKTLVNNDHPQVIEIWNIVFMQFNRLKDGSLQPLPARHVDTGMGFERLVRVIQQKASNYDTDVFTGTIAAVEKLVEKKYDLGDSRQAIAFRVLADHIRAIAFAIADGQLPSNTGAGYVIRRILRRAVRYYYSYLDYKQPLLFQLVPVLAKQFENVFSEISFQLDFVTKVIKEEEDAFLKTLANGIRIFESYVKKEEESATDSKTPGETTKPNTADQDSRNSRIVSGAFAFKLNDTFGFPVDLTGLMAREIGWTVDETGFETEMRQQKNRSKAAAAMDTGDWINLHSETTGQFAGYDLLETQTNIIKYRKVVAKGKESFQLVLENTPFYAESGGQVGDTGELISNNEKIPVTGTRKENDLIIHFTDRLPAILTGTVIAKVDNGKRKKTAIHHSATHLLHAALRRVLGTHVAQKGSLVNEEHLRFDFSHFAKMTDDELARVEEIVNEKIRENIPVVIQQLPKDAALKLGAMALFGEKYGNVVRVVTIDPEYSVELCGGTHAGATGELGFFRIKQETAVAAGVRRIEAVSGQAAQIWINQAFLQLQQAKEQLKHPADLGRAIDNLLTENTGLKKKLEHLEDRVLVGVRNELLHKDEIINGVTFIGAIVEVNNADALKKLCFDLKNKLHDHLIILCANIGGKPFVALGIAETVAAAKNLDAGKIIKEHISPLIKGGGGGQKTLATAGGQEAGNLQQVIENVKSLLH